MNALWFCTTASLAALCVVCLWSGALRTTRLYVWLQFSFLALAPLLIWAYYSPAVGQHAYEQIWYWSQRYTQAGEFVIFVMLIRPSLPFAYNLIGAMNMLYFLLKTQTNADYDVPEEIVRSFDFFVQQWANLAVIIASCIALAWCKFSQEKRNETALHQAPR